MDALFDPKGFVRLDLWKSVGRGGVIDDALGQMQEIG